MPQADPLVMHSAFWTGFALGWLGATLVLMCVWFLLSWWLNRDDGYRWW